MIKGKTTSLNFNEFKAHPPEAERQVHRAGATALDER
jgi:hypothetical protein